MRDLTNEILELIRRTSSDLPLDVEERLRLAVSKEAPGSAARGAFETILKNVELSRKNSSPICQDTGTTGRAWLRPPEGTQPENRGPAPGGWQCSPLGGQP